MMDNDSVQLPSRGLPDRRRKPTGPWDSFRLLGRRQQARRYSEHVVPYFVDRFSSWLFVGVFAILLLTLADGILTINLMDVDCTELNPLMAALMKRGQGSFLFGKYLLTVAGLPFLLVFKNYFLFKTRFRVGYLIPAFVTIYTLLLGYQLYLASDLLY